MRNELKVTENITLYLPTTSEASTLYKMIAENRGHLEVFLDWVENTKSIQDSIENIEKRIKGFEKNTSLDYLVKYDNICVGSVGFVKINTKNKNGEIGYWVEKKSEGKGIISSCVKTLIEYGFSELELHRITIKVNSKNSKSQNIAKRFNFKHEGTVRDDFFDGKEFSNTEIFGLLKDEYKSL